MAGTVFWNVPAIVRYISKQITNGGGSMLYIAVFAVCLFASIAGAICGIGGGIAGRMMNRKLSDKLVNRLFILLMVVILFINVYNIYRFTVS